MKIRVNRWRLESPKVGREVRLLVMTDVHDNASAFADLRRVVERERPDYICLAGDTLDRADCEAGELVAWLRGLASLATVVIGLGNHELVEKGKHCRRATKRASQSPGFGRATTGAAMENWDFYAAVEATPNCVLLRERFEVWEAAENVTFAALNMPEEWYQAHESKAEFREMLEKLPAADSAAGAAARGLEAGRLNVLLSHSPNGWLYRGKLWSREEVAMLKKLDLILCGHNHGGLVPKGLRPLFRQYGLVGPRYRVGQAHAFGSWTDGQTSLVLSNGVTKVAKTTGLGAVGRALCWLYAADVELIRLVAGE